MALWDEVKQNLVEWYTSAAVRTDQLARLGMRAYDRYGISRDIERQFAELGSHVYRLRVEEGREDILGDEGVERALERVQALETELRLTQGEMDDLRRRRQGSRPAGGSKRREYENEESHSAEAEESAGGKRGPEWPPD